MNVKEIKPYAEAFGIIAFVLAIVGFFVPIVGVLFITPIAIIFGILALLAGYNKSMSLATVIIIGVNLLISPSFWLNVLASPFSGANAFFTLFDIIGLAALIYLLVKAYNEPAKECQESQETDQK